MERLRHWEIKIWWVTWQSRTYNITEKFRSRGNESRYYKTQHKIRRNPKMDVERRNECGVEEDVDHCISLQAQIHEWCWELTALYTHWQYVTSLLIVLNMHCDLISVCLEVFISHWWKYKIEWSHFTVITIIWYMRFASSMIPSVGSKFCCLHVHVFT